MDGLNRTLSQSHPLQAPRRDSWGTSPDIPHFADYFKLGVDDTLKSSNDLDEILVIGALGTILSRMA